MVLGATGVRAIADKRVGVAPWDFPDGPNPYPGALAGAPSVKDPKGLVRSANSEGSTDNGYSIKLVALGRRGLNSMDEILPDARPIWKPDGSPNLGHSATGMVDNPGGVLEDRGARYLTFEFTGPKPGQVDVMGYVPDRAREETPRPEFHGWDRAHWTYAGPKRIYGTCVVVDDRSASHYRFAVADGEWVPVASAPYPPYKRQNATLLRGPWGTVRRVVIPRPRSTSRWTMKDEHGTYVASESTLAPSNELRVRFLDAAGKEVHPNGWPQGATPATMIVESRPWHWVEISGVHYDPDPAKWPKGYWGEEGERSVSRAGGTSLEAIILPAPNEYQGWDPADVYAPDGRLWRNHPDVRSIRPSFSGGELLRDPLVAALRLDETRVSASTPARIEAFAAASAVPGQDLRERLRPWSTIIATRPVAQVLLNRPTRPYVQFAVRYGSEEWTKIGEIILPKLEIPHVDPKGRSGYGVGAVGNTILSLGLRNDGHAVLDWRRGEEHESTQKSLVWPEDGDVRVIARMRSGERIPLVRSSPGIRGRGTSCLYAAFSLTNDADGLYDGLRQGGITQGQVRLNQISAFEFEAQRPSEPVYVTAKLPPSHR